MQSSIWRGRAAPFLAVLLLAWWSSSPAPAAADFGNQQGGLQLSCGNYGLGFACFNNTGFARSVTARALNSTDMDWTALRVQQVGAEYTYQVRVYDLTFSGGLWHRGSGRAEGFDWTPSCLSNATTDLPWPNGVPPKQVEVQITVAAAEKRPAIAGCNASETSGPGSWGYVLGLPSSETPEVAGLNKAWWPQVQTGGQARVCRGDRRFIDFVGQCPGGFLQEPLYPTATPTTAPPTATATAIPPTVTSTPVPAPSATPLPPGTVVDYTGPLESIGGAIDQVKGQVAEGVAAIGGLPGQFADQLGAKATELVVPSEGFFDGQVATVRGDMEGRFPIVGQLNGIGDTLAAGSSETSCEAYVGIALPLYGSDARFPPSQFMVWWCPWRPLVGVLMSLGLTIAAVRRTLRILGPRAD